MTTTNSEKGVAMNLPPDRKHRAISPIIEGDGLRESALAAIRKRDLIGAQALIERASQLHHNDEDRMAALQMTRARLCLAKGDEDGAREAQSLHNHAHAAWEGMQKRGVVHTPQWVMENRFHYLRAMAATDYSSPTELRTLLGTEARLGKRLRARMMHAFGKFGFRIDQLLFGH